MDKDKLQKYVGKKIEEFRKKKGFTQAELAKKIGEFDSSLKVKNNTISAYERGEVNIGMNTLFVLSRVLEVKMDDFVPPRKNQDDQFSIDRVPSKTNKELTLVDLQRIQEMVDKASSVDTEGAELIEELLKANIALYKKLKS